MDTSRFAKRLKQMPILTNHLRPEILSADFSKLLVGEEWTDVTFIVEGEPVKAHRIIVASRCKYFRTLLFGDFVESTQNEIPMTVKAEPFKFILRYLYTGRCDLSDREVENLIEILDLAHQYDIGQLVSRVGWDFKRMLSTETIHWILNIALLYDMKELLDESLKFADLNAPSVVSHVAFTSLSDATVKELLKRDSFAVTEIDIFNAVKAWCDKRPTRENADILGLVRWSLISSDDLVKVVRRSGVVSPDVLLDAIEQQSSGKLPFRFVLIKDKEIPYKNISGQSGIDLGRIHFINCIKWPSLNIFQLVEVSVDSQCWKPLSVSECQVKDMPSAKEHWKFPVTGTRFIRIRKDDHIFYNIGVSSEWLDGCIEVMHRSDI